MWACEFETLRISAFFPPLPTWLIISTEDLGLERRKHAGQSGPGLVAISPHSMRPEIWVPLSSGKGHKAALGPKGVGGCGVRWCLGLF